MIRIASFDIGHVNFAQYVGDVDVKKGRLLSERYHALPKKMQRRVKGPMNEEIEDILEELYLIDKRVQTGVYNLSDGDHENKNADLTDAVYLRIVQHLEEYKWLWNTCDIFVFERQYFRTQRFGKGGRNGGTEGNVKALKVEASVKMWFMLNYPDIERVTFNSQNKTHTLGAGNGLKKPQRKTWAEEKAEIIYRVRGDDDMIALYDLKLDIFRKRFKNVKNAEEKIRSFLEKHGFGEGSSRNRDVCRLAERMIREKQKLDDISDAMLQHLAFVFKDLIAKF